MSVKMEDFTISDLAQAVVLGLGAVSALLLVLWQSRCLCRCRLGISDQCYIFDCSREPPPTIDEEKGKEKEKDKEKDKLLEKEEQILPTPRSLIDEIVIDLDDKV
jgi:hypothetical protein